MSLDPRFSVGRVATVEVAAPNPTAQDVGLKTTSSAVSVGGMLSSSGAAVQGQLSLSMLMAGIVALLAFYYWTRTAQGGG